MTCSCAFVWCDVSVCAFGVTCGRVHLQFDRGKTFDERVKDNNNKLSDIIDGALGDGSLFFMHYDTRAYSLSPIHTQSDTFTHTVTHTRTVEGCVKEDGTCYSSALCMT